MYLTQSLHRSMQQTPDAIASIYRDRRHSFSQLGERVARFAGALHAQGLEANDRIAMLALNSDRYLEYYLGTWWAGAVASPVNTRWAVPEIAYSLNDCASRFLLVDEAFVGMVAELRETCPSLEAVIYAGEGSAPQDMLSYEELLASAAPAKDALHSGDDLAVIYYTGGTTGASKGVMLSHANLFTNSVALLAEGGVRTHAVGLHAAPMFHLADGCFMNALLAGGGCHVIVQRFDPVAVFEAIQRNHVSGALLVPTMIQMLADHPSVGKYDLSSFSDILYGASPISESVLKRAMQAFPSARFTQVYGATELSPVATILPWEMHGEAGRNLGLQRAAGRAIISCEVRIVDAEDCEVARGEVGEITVRGPGVMLGYWNKPEATAAALHDGWLHTGDAGRMDKHGYVTLVDRVKDMIISGGENVYSVEVENAVAAHPAVAQCAVIGVPSDRWGELVHACVVLKPDAQVTANDLIDHCKRLIAGYKCPREVSFLDEMPLSGAGKIMKRSLRESFWRGHERHVA